MGKCVTQSLDTNPFKTTAFNCANNKRKWRQSSRWPSTKLPIQGCRMVSNISAEELKQSGIKRQFDVDERLDTLQPWFQLANQVERSLTNVRSFPKMRMFPIKIPFQPWCRNGSKVKGKTYQIVGYMRFLRYSTLQPMKIGIQFEKARRKLLRIDI